MKIKQVTLKRKNKLMNDYQNDERKIMQYFDDHPFKSYEKRIQYLKNRTFKRKELVEALLTMNKHWGAPESTLENIERLRSDRSVVVIGGQQAGLLTGPMYTIHKIISILKFAKEQEEVLNTPVIPIFWIAGEDHDFDEINHIHLYQSEGMRKHQITQYMNRKLPISDIEIDQVKAKRWIDKLFKELHETEYTKPLYKNIQNCLAKSSTYVDFFARILFVLFDQHGIVLFDSNNSQTRQLESEYFIHLIEHQGQLAKEIFRSTATLKQEGYSLTLDVTESDAHLFYHHHGERILLQRTENGDWLGKHNEVRLTTEELISIARHNPHLLSNNVITRPLMQEMVFPTLAFIGGWGEISYWSVLKKAFHLFDLKVPPILPRLSFTFIGPKTAKIMERYNIRAEYAINYGIKQKRANWLASKYDPPIEQLAEQIKQDISDIHKPLRDIAQQMTTSINQLADRNVYYLQQEIDYLVHRMKKEIKQRYHHELNDFSMLEQILYPHGNLQERIWNPIYLLNMTDKRFISNLIEEPLSFTEDHYAIYL